MSKIAIVSNAEEGVVIDISGCDSPAEAKHYLASTLQVSSRFWDGLTVDLNLGRLTLTNEEVADILAIVSEVGVDPARVMASDMRTVAALYQVTKKQPVETASGSMSVLSDPLSKETREEYEAALPQLAFDSPVNAGLTVAADPVSAGVSLVEQMTMELTNEESPQIDEVVRTPMVSEQHLSTSSDEVPRAVPLPAVAEASSSSVFLSQAVAAPITSHSLQPVAVAIPLAPVLIPSADSSRQSQPAQKAATRAVADRSAGVLYLRQTLRSGQAVSHKGDLVIIGDVNPGAEVSAEGDITIWGALRGIAHAGTAGNANAEIRALKFDPIQLRIAHAIARAPDRSKTGFINPSGPETARIFEGKIRISGSDPD